MDALSKLEWLIDHRVPADIAAQMDVLVHKVLDEHAHELANKLRNVFRDGTGNDWDWGDGTTIPESCANLIDPEA